MSLGRFQGQVAIVTGGSSGIGFATMTRLLEEGARVAVFDLTPLPSIVAKNNSVRFFEVDVTQKLSVGEAVAQVVSEWNTINVVVNCAGVAAIGTVVDNDEAEWSRVWDINVLGTARVIGATIHHLKLASPASVVNLGSAVAHTGFPNRVLYTATKGAVVAMTRAMASDYLADGVRFNSVCPGTTDTPWLTGLFDASDDPEEERRKLNARQPHGRLVSPDEIADAILYLANPLAGSTNGVSLSVDGGIESLFQSK
jgi:NAD(P)-dependent dehydrogenase (short-subunit alcohol dehydrogenase family)